MEARGEFDFEMFRAALRRRWILVVFSVVVLVELSALYSYLRAETYSATAVVVIASSPAEDLVQSSSATGTSADREMGNEVRLALSRRVESRVSGSLGVVPDIEVVADRNADVLEFRAVGSTPEEAADFANVWAGTYVDVKREDAAASVTNATDELRTRLAELRADRQATRRGLDLIDDQLDSAAEEDIEALERQRQRLAFDLAPELDAITLEEAAIIESLTQLQIGSLLALQGTVGVIDEAVPPMEPSGLTMLQGLTVAAFIGLVLGIALALIRDATDSRVRTVQDLESSAGVPLLAVIPLVARRRGRRPRVETVFDADRGMVEAFQGLRSAIEFAVNGDDIQVMVTSAMPSEGKTTTAANLALALANSGDDTVVIDGDLRRPRLHEMFGIDNERGVAEYIESGTDPEDLLVSVDVDGGSIRVLPAGRRAADPSRILAAGGLDGILSDPAITSMVVDSPPVLPVSDTLSLSRSIGAVVLVARAGTSRKGEVREAALALRRRGVKLIGVVMVGGRVGSRYGYYEDDGEVVHQIASADRGRQTGEVSAKLRTAPAVSGKG